MEDFLHIAIRVRIQPVLDELDAMIYIHRASGKDWRLFGDRRVNVIRRADVLEQTIRLKRHRLGTNLNLN